MHDFVDVVVKAACLFIIMLNIIMTHCRQYEGFNVLDFNFKAD